MKRRTRIWANIFYLGGATLIASLGILLFMLRLENNLFFVDSFIVICIIYVLIFIFLNWQTPEVFFYDAIWNEDAGAAWQRKVIKKIQTLCLAIDRKLKSIFKK